jgi:hypothetical protein
LNKKVIIGIGTGIVVAGIIAAVVAMRSTGPSGEGGIIPTEKLGTWENPVPLGHPFRIKSWDGEFEITVESVENSYGEFTKTIYYTVRVRIKAITDTSIMVPFKFCLVDINGRKYEPGSCELQIDLAPGGIETTEIEWGVPEGTKIIRMGFKTGEETYYFALA